MQFDGFKGLRVCQISEEVSDNLKSFIQSFVSPAKRERYLYLLEHDKLSKLATDLDHKMELDRRHCTQIPDRLRYEEAIGYVSKALKEKGAGDFCVVWPMKHDGAEACSLDDGVRSLFEVGGGRILIAIPGRLAAYRAEDPSDCFICFRSNAD